jgi:hypothetical protein
VPDRPSSHAAGNCRRRRPARRSAGHLDDCKEAAETGVAVERQGDAGEIDHARVQQAFGHQSPFRQLEQLARGRAIAPVEEAALTFAVGFDQIEPGHAVSNTQHEIAGDPFGPGHLSDCGGIWIVAQRRRIGDVDPGAGKIDRGIERVATEGEAITTVAPARQLHHHLADGYDTGLRLGHDIIPEVATGVRGTPQDSFGRESFDGRKTPAGSRPA